MAFWNKKQSEGHEKAAPKKDVIEPNVSSRSGLYWFSVLMFAIGLPWHSPRRFGRFSCSGRS